MSCSLLLPSAARNVGRLLLLFRFHDHHGGHHHTTFRTQDTRQNYYADPDRHHPRWNIRHRHRWRLRQHFQRIFRRIGSRLRRRLRPWVFVALISVRLTFLVRPWLLTFFRIPSWFPFVVVVVVMVPVTIVLRMRVIAPPIARILTVRPASVLT